MTTSHKCADITLFMHPMSVGLPLPTVVFSIHVIFSWAEIGRSAIFGREIGVPDREIFSRQKIFNLNVKNCLFASP